MAPSPPQNGHISGPRDTWDPEQGSLGPHLACDQNLVGRENPFFGIFGPFWAPDGLKMAVFSLHRHPIGETKTPKRGSLVEKLKIQFPHPIFLTHDPDLTPTTWPSDPPKRHFRGSQGHTGPQTGLIGSALTMQSNLVSRGVTQNGLYDQENPIFLHFRPVSGPGWPKNG